MGQRGICGYRVEEIEAPIMQKVRYLDKVVDGPIRIGPAISRAMEKILRN
jgi:hypothetical protein